MMTMPMMLVLVWFAVKSDYLQGTAEFTEVDLVASKSSLIYSIIEEEETPAQASTQSMLSYLRGVDHDYNRSRLLVTDA